MVWNEACAFSLTSRPYLEVEVFLDRASQCRPLKVPDHMARLPSGPLINPQPYSIWFRMVITNSGISLRAQHASQHPKRQHIFLLFPTYTLPSACPTLPLNAISSRSNKISNTLNHLNTSFVVLFISQKYKHTCIYMCKTHHMLVFTQVNTLPS